jgi:hypothetical protein
MIFLNHGLTNLCTHLQKQFIKIFEKKYVKDPTNHTLLGPGANELHAHLQNNDKKFVGQSWLLGLMA